MAAVGTEPVGYRGFFSAFYAIDFLGGFGGFPEIVSAMGTVVGFRMGDYEAAFRTVSSSHQVLISKISSFNLSDLFRLKNGIHFQGGL